MWACKKKLSNRNVNSNTQWRKQWWNISLVKRSSKDSTQENEEALLRHNIYKLHRWEGLEHTLHKSSHKTIRKYKSVTKANRQKTSDDTPQKNDTKSTSSDGRRKIYNSISHLLERLKFRFLTTNLVRIWCNLYTTALGVGGGKMLKLL